jgi:hypothetical protein
MTMFVERRFESSDTQLIPRFGAPTKAVAGDSSAASHRTGRCGYACGEDDIQALMLAMKKVHIALVESDAYRQGQLTLWGQLDLDLPPTWGAGPLYYVPPLKVEHPDESGENGG